MQNTVTGNSATKGKQDIYRLARSTAILCTGVMLKIVSTAMTLPQDPRGYTLGARAVEFVVPLGSYFLVLSAIAVVIGLMRKNRGLRGLDWKTGAARWTSPRGLGRAAFMASIMYPVFAWLFLAAGLMDICVAVYQETVCNDTRNASSVIQPTPSECKDWRVLVALIRDEPSTNGYEAANALGGLGPIALQALPSLVELIRDGSRITPLSTADPSMLAGGDPDPSPPDEVLRLRKRWLGGFYAIHALGAIGLGAEAAVAMLIESLHSSDPTIQIKAAWALGRIGPSAKDAVPALADLQNKSPFPCVQDTAASALEAIRWYGIAEPGRVRNPPVVRDNSSLFKWQCRLLYRPRISDQLGAIQAIGDLGTDARPAVPALITVLKRDDASTRAKAAWALGQVGPSARLAIPALRGLASSDSNPHVREAAQSALLRIEQSKETKNE